MRLKLSVRYTIWGFPYRAEEKTSSINYGYFDLKKDSNQISRIPEVKDWPDLEEFIREANSPESFFRTLGCDVGYSDETSDQFHVKSYVDIAFEILTINFDKFNYYLLFDRLENRFKRAQLTQNISADFTIQYTVFNDHKLDTNDDVSVTGWTLVVRLHSVGETRDQARSQWASALAVLRISLSEISAENRGVLLERRQTIS